MARLEMLRSLLFTDNPDAEHQLIASYLNMLEGVCNEIAERFNCEFEELLSEGYVILVSDFQSEIATSRVIYSTKGMAGAEGYIQRFDETMMERLTESIEKYAESITYKGKRLVEEPSSNAVPHPSKSTKRPSIEELPKAESHLIEPFTRLAHAYQKVYGTCLPQCKFNDSEHMQLINAVFPNITVTEATALVQSYRTYARTILEAYFGDMGV